jgi:CheY-like chemotaxis protein
VTVCDSGMKALELLQQPELNVDLILADVMMPVMDGFQLLSEIRKDDRHHHIPVVMMSGIDTRDEIGKCLASGADSYLIKPLRMQVDLSLLA